MVARFAAIGILLGATAPGAGDAPRAAAEWQVKREAVFEFARKPAVTREGDRVTIGFETKGFCDVTVAVEDEKGRIVRHLASGVLGPDAPEPFRKNALKQMVVWDGKDDQGAYIDDKDRLTVRVSLGLKPRFERALFWAPGKRTRDPTYLSVPPVVAAAEDGVYVYDGGNGDHVRLFDHEGNYVRTVYPFPAEKLSGIKDLQWHTFPQDGRRAPLKWTLFQTTLLTHGDADYGHGRWPVKGTGATSIKMLNEGNPIPVAMDARGGRIALASVQLSRLAADGSTGGRPLTGPKTSVTAALDRTMVPLRGEREIKPTSIALSPDGKWAYCAGYTEIHYWGQTLCGITRVPFDHDGKPDTFAGRLECRGMLARHERTSPLQLPAAVACDSQGRVYVADYLADAVRVYKSDGTHLKDIPATRPAQVVVSPKNGEIYVFSWQISHKESWGKPSIPSTVRRLKSLDDPQELGAWPLPVTLSKNDVRATVDVWADPPCLWIVGGAGKSREYGWGNSSPRLYAFGDRALVLKRHLGVEARRQVVYLRPIRHGKQRLYFDPRHERLYVGELFAPCVFHVTAMLDAARIDPETGHVEKVDLPFDAEDMAFGPDGYAYLRTENRVARYDPQTWQEVPFDYGTDLPGTSVHGIKGAHTRSAIAFTGQLGISTGQMGGMYVSPRGNVVVTACNQKKAPDRRTTPTVGADEKRPETLLLYPGRATPWAVHVWDRYGRSLYRDAVPSIGRLAGVLMDRDDNIYIMEAGTGRMGGRPYFNPVACAYVKCRPNSRFLATRAPLPLPPKNRPKRPPDLVGVENAGNVWLEGAAWVRGGVGFDGKRVGCHCASQSRPALDFFARSFLPETDHYSVLVLDTNGNEVCRVGRYGNVDDGMPLVAQGGPPHPRSIGGDEVAIMHAQFLAVHSDRRLFIGDLGNACIRSVKLDYHATERVALKGVPHDRS